LSEIASSSNQTKITGTLHDLQSCLPACLLLLGVTDFASISAKNVLNKSYGKK